MDGNKEATTLSFLKNPPDRLELFSSKIKGLWDTLKIALQISVSALVRDCPVFRKC